MYGKSVLHTGLASITSSIRSFLTTTASVNNHASQKGKWKQSPLKNEVLEGDQFSTRMHNVLVPGAGATGDVRQFETVQEQTTVTGSAQNGRVKELQSDIVGKTSTWQLNERKRKSLISGGCFGMCFSMKPRNNEVEATPGGYGNNGGGGDAGNGGSVAGEAGRK